MNISGYDSCYVNSSSPALCSFTEKWLLKILAIMLMLDINGYSFSLTLTPSLGAWCGMRD